MTVKTIRILLEFITCSICLKKKSWERNDKTFIFTYDAVTFIEDTKNSKSGAEINTH
jgi:hypothetical protein